MENISQKDEKLLMSKLVEELRVTFSNFLKEHYNSVSDNTLLYILLGSLASITRHTFRFFTNEKEKATAIKEYIEKLYLSLNLNDTQLEILSNPNNQVFL